MKYWVKYGDFPGYNNISEEQFRDIINDGAGCNIADRIINTVITHSKKGSGCFISPFIKGFIGDKPPQ